MRSSYIDWLLEQQWRPDETGELARWVSAKPDLEPLEFQDILEEIGDDTDRKQQAFDTLLEFGIIIKEEGADINIIDSAEIDKYKLERAIRNENYEEAARLRDKQKEK